MEDGGDVMAVVAARKVMVVVDSSKESIGALQYTLFNEVVQQDELVLIHVENPNSWKNPFSAFLRRPNVLSNLISSMAASPATSSSSFNERERELPPLPPGATGDFLEEMKYACEVIQPEVVVHTVRVQTESNNKAAAILWQTEMLEIDLLVIGQQRSRSSPSNSILAGIRRIGGSPSLSRSSSNGTKGMDTIEYLIENCKCICVAVQKNGQNGYLLSTKTRKNFWLLA
ncbi:hypothetical protein LWI28_012345 [Acer negundo]|uniref:UspA domain-containing protein n=1 Tax=Acer negundo TaxID=4023 RepID=A0AAD5NGM6_ACENE|nr:hypothetical protein LWI28_012345 [Acer negundo]KAK4834912.1 hypothetical protein QYF36_002410 [Acer negundo]